MPGRVLVVDGNNILARGTHAWPQAATPDGFPVGGLYGMVKFIRDYLARNEGYDSVVVAIDAGVPEFRKRLCPEYKAQRADKRKEDPEQVRIYKNYKQQVKVADLVAAGMGVVFARADGWEGDDVVAALTLRRFADRGVTIYSSDKDFTELVTEDERVRLYDPIKAEFALPCRTYLFERLMDPKPSDNLDGVRGIGETKAAQLMEWFAAEVLPRLQREVDPKIKLDTIEGLEAFLMLCQDVAGKGIDKKAPKELQKIGKLCAMVAPAAEKMRANYRVTCLRRIARRCDEQLALTYHPSSLRQFKDMARTFGLGPLLQDITAIWPVYARLDHTWAEPYIPEAG